MTIDGNPKSLSGRFSDGKILLLALWNASEHKLTKKDFDKQYPEVRRKGKLQLQDKIGAKIFDSIYLDGGRMDDFIALSNDIEIKMLP